MCTAYLGGAIWEKVRGIIYKKKKNNYEKKEKEENEKILIYFIFTKLVPAPSGSVRSYVYCVAD